MSSGSFSNRRLRTLAHLLAGASLLLTALFSFLPLTATSANAADMSCSEMVAADVVTIASMCPSAPTNVSIQAADHGIEAGKRTPQTKDRCPRAPDLRAQQRENQS